MAEEVFVAVVDGSSMVKGQYNTPRVVEFLGSILNSTFFTRGSTTLKYSVHRTCCCLGSSCLFGWLFEEALELITILRRSEAGDCCEI